MGRRRLRTIFGAVRSVWRAIQRKRSIPQRKALDQLRVSRRREIFKSSQLPVIRLMETPGVWPLLIQLWFILYRAGIERWKHWGSTTHWEKPDAEDNRRNRSWSRSRAVFQQNKSRGIAKSGLFVILDARRAKEAAGDGAFGRSSQTCCGRCVRRGHVAQCGGQAFRGQHRQRHTLGLAVPGDRRDLPGSDGRGSSVEPH